MIIIVSLDSLFMKLKKLSHSSCSSCLEISLPFHYIHFIEPLGVLREDNFITSPFSLPCLYDFLHQPFLCPSFIFSLSLSRSLVCINSSLILSSHFSSFTSWWWLSWTELVILYRFWNIYPQHLYRCYSTKASIWRYFKNWFNFLRLLKKLSYKFTKHIIFLYKSFLTINMKFYAFKLKTK